MRRTLFLAVSILISGLFLWLALRDIPFTEVIDRIRQIQLPWLMASLLCIVLGLTVRAIRWSGLLDFRVPLLQAFHILNISFLLNQFPLRAGEVARSLLATRSGVPLVTAATSIVVEKLLDTLLVVVLLAVGLSRVPDAPAEAARTVTLFGALSVVAFIVLVIFARYPGFPHRLLDLLEARLALVKRLRLRPLLDHLLQGLRPLTIWRVGLQTVLLTLIAWGFSLGTFYTLARAFDIMDDGLFTMLAVSLASFSVAVPVSVAAIGPFEYAVQIAGQLVGISELTATSIGFMFHWETIVAYAVFGTIGLLALGVSLAELTKTPQIQAEVGNQEKTI